MLRFSSFCKGRKEHVSLDLKPVLLDSRVHWPEEPGVSNDHCLKARENCLLNS